MPNPAKQIVLGTALLVGITITLLHGSAAGRSQPSASTFI
jgi:hypothetical protein